MANLLTPQETLQALIDGKQIRWKFKRSEKWNLLDDHDISLKDILCNEVEFSLAPEMITIGDVSFPKPETKEPKPYTNYFFPNFNNSNLVDFHKWTSDEFDYKLLKAGLVHLTKENAIAHVKALIKLSGGKYE